MYFFPSIYKEEILCSAFARYHHRSGNAGPKETMEDLFSDRNVTATMELPSHISAFFRNLPVGSVFTADRLINEHTLFPLFANFLPESRARWLKESMLGSNSKGIYSKVGIIASSISTNTYFKFCPECVEEDKEKLGETYWRRTHQVPGVFICPTHNCFLLDSNLPVKSNNKHEYSRASENNCRPYEVPRYSKLTLKHMKDISIIIHEIVTGNILYKPHGWFQRQYQERLKELGYASQSGSIALIRLKEDFLDYYGSETLSAMQSHVETTESGSWMADMIRRSSDGVAHPLRHVLLSKFLGVPIEDLLFKEICFQPFGKGPWPCLNPIAEHYLENRINDIDINYSHSTKKPMGNFKCRCGFEYVRKGPEKNEDDRYKYSKVLSYGHLWEQKLAHVVANAKSLRGAAREMNVDPKTISKYCGKLGIKQGWKKKEESLMITDEFYNTKKTNNCELKAGYENDWLELMREHPGASKTELRHKKPDVYIWLYRNNRAWLDKNSPKRKIKYVNNRVDWAERDLEVLEEVKEAIGQILHSNEKPQRITIGLIGYMINKRPLLEKKLSKLPMTQSYLEVKCESLRDFRIRRIKWAAEELNKKGEGIKKWRVLRMACIRGEYIDDVEEELDSIIAFYER